MRRAFRGALAAPIETSRAILPLPPPCEVNVSRQQWLGIGGGWGADVAALQQKDRGCEGEVGWVAAGAHDERHGLKGAAAA